MKLRLLSAAALALTMTLIAHSQTVKATDELQAQLKVVESQFVPAAEAMPADKYDFAPTQGEFKTVRTFAEEVRHVAATNFDLAAAILGEKPPVETDGPKDSGPADVKSKDEIVKYLKDSFDYSRKALQQVNEKNIFQQTKGPWDGKPKSRLWLSEFMVWHSFDHYGQMVEYLRMNGIIPPASRGGQ